VLILRIRQAECALADGRLDEAFELADRHDVRSHRRGQRLVGKLVRSLAERGRKHLDAGRLAEAAADSEKARRFGGLMPEVAELRNKTADALLAKHRAERSQARLVAAARYQIDRGHLSTGGKLLAAVADQQSAAGVMLRDVEARQGELTTAVARAEAALQRDDWEAAARQLARVRPADSASDSAYTVLASRVSKLARRRVQTALDDGDVRLAGAMLDRLLLVDGQGIETQHLRQAVAQCRLAWDHIDRCQPRQAEEIVRRLATLLPGAKWVGTIARQLHQAAELMDELRAGPLGLCAVGSMEETQPARPPHPAPPTIPHSPGNGNGNGNAIQFARAAPTPPPIPQLIPPSGEVLPPRFVLQVDGAGSYVVLTQPRVTIGPVSSSRAPDLGLMTDASAASAIIERVEEDYFLRPAGAMAVNGRASSGKLLASGDELGLSPRCRLTFRLPSAASTSAVLDLTGARVPRADVRRVILLDRELVIGPGVGAHVRVDELTDKVVLVVRDGRLFVQTAQPVLVGEREVAPRSPVPIGAHVKAGPVSFVATKS
jgi:tetratricopeptide (TPR) repeat protein